MISGRGSCFIRRRRLDGTAYRVETSLTNTNLISVSAYRSDRNERDLVMVIISTVLLQSRRSGTIFTQVYSPLSQGQTMLQLLRSGNTFFYHCLGSTASRPSSKKRNCAFIPGNLNLHWHRGVILEESIARGVSNALDERLGIHPHLVQSVDLLFLLKIVTLPESRLPGYRSEIDNFSAHPYAPASNQITEALEALRVHQYVVMEDGRDATTLLREVEERSGRVPDAVIERRDPCSCH